MLGLTIVVRHIIRYNAPCGIELNANAWASWTLLMRGLSRDRYRATSSSRTGVSVTVARRGTVASGRTTEAVAVVGNGLHSRTCAPRDRGEWLRACAASLSSDTSPPTLRTERAAADA